MHLCDIVCWLLLLLLPLLCMMFCVVCFASVVYVRVVCTRVYMLFMSGEWLNVLMRKCVFSCVSVCVVYICLLCECVTLLACVCLCVRACVVLCVCVRFCASVCLCVCVFLCVARDCV